MEGGVGIIHGTSRYKTPPRAAQSPAPREQPGLAGLFSQGGRHAKIGAALHAHCPPESDGMPSGYCVEESLGETEPKPARQLAGGGTPQLPQPVASRSMAWARVSNRERRSLAPPAQPPLGGKSSSGHRPAQTPPIPAHDWLRTTSTPPPPADSTDSGEDIARSKRQTYSIESCQFGCPTGEPPCARLRWSRAVSLARSHSALCPTAGKEHVRCQAASHCVRCGDGGAATAARRGCGLGT